MCYHSEFGRSALKDVGIKHTQNWTPGDSKDRAYAQRGAVKTRICAAEMAVRYAALCACRKVHSYVTLAHKRKPKFFYFGCSVVRRCNCK